MSSHCESALKTPNPSIELTYPCKPGHAFHVKRHPLDRTLQAAHPIPRGHEKSPKSLINLGLWPLQPSAGTVSGGASLTRNMA